MDRNGTVFYLLALTSFLAQASFDSVFVVLNKCRDYFGGAVCKSENHLDGKTVIVTGANCGIGKETAKDLARRGVYIVTSVIIIISVCVTLWKG